METVELAIITTLDAGHVVPSVDLGKTLTSRDNHISVTIFIVESPLKTKLTSYTQTLLSNQPPPRMQFVSLTADEPTLDNLPSKFSQSRIKDFYSSEGTHRPKAFVLDIFCITFADVANELGVPSYVFYTSSACGLSILCYLQFLQDDQNQDIFKLKDSNTDLSVPGFVNPVPTNVLPSLALWSNVFVHVPRAMRKFKGILVNTFEEMESYAIKCFSEGMFPPIYAVGPVLSLNTTASSSLGSQNEEIMTWLDNQPTASVVFLCFGSLGTFKVEQVAEIAHSLEQSGHRFLWALRQPSGHDSANDVLPDGFLNRTKEIGKVIEWAPQMAVLSHAAVGGFVSHCGWNSILESLWCGVPIAAWPLYAEQQMNAFELVKELGLAVEIKIDYMQDSSITLNAEVIKRGIKQLMEGGESTKIKSKVKAMSGEIRRAMVEGGSSYITVGHFIEEVLGSSL